MKKNGNESLNSNHVCKSNFDKRVVHFLLSEIKETQQRAGAD